MDLNVIRRVKVVAEEQGVDQTRAKVESLAGSMGALGAAAATAGTQTDTSSRKVLSTQSAYDRLQRSLDLTYRAQQQMVGAEATLKRAREQGLASVEREIQLLDAAKLKYFGVSAAAKEAAEQVARLASLRAEQAGGNFQTTLDEHFGITGEKATARGASYSALSELLDAQAKAEDERREQQRQVEKQIDDARSAHFAAVTQQGYADQFGYGRGAGSARSSAEIFEEDARKAEEAARRIKAAGEYAAGGWSRLNSIGRPEFERITGNARANEQLKGLGSKSVGGPDQRKAVRPDQLTNFGYQASDVFTQLASGGSLFTVAAQQGPQIAQTGLLNKEGLSAIASKVSSVVTPVRVLTAGVIGLGVAAVASYSDWLAQQKALEASLTGVGRGTALTARGLNDLAVANSRAGGVSNATARDIAGAYAATGKIGTDTLAALVRSTRDYAATTGQEIPEAASELARAFSDPVRGADALNAKLGFLDATSMRTIQHLAATGDAKGAQKALYDAMITGIDSAEKRLILLGRIWEGTKQTISNAWTGIFEGPSIEAEIKRLETLRDAAQRGIYGPRGAGNALGGGAAAAKGFQDEIDRLRKEQSDAKQRADNQDRGRRSLDAQNYLQGIDSTANTVQRLEEELTKLKRQMDDGLFDDDGFKRGTDQANKLKQAIGSLREENGKLRSDLDRAKDAFAVQFDAIGARTAQQRADITARQYRQSIIGQKIDPKVADFNEDAARKLVLGQSAEDEKRYREQQAESRRQSISSLQAELASVGQSAEAQDRLRKTVEATNEARQHAYELTGDYNRVSRETIDALGAQADAEAKLNQQIREQNLAKDMARERRLLPMADDETSTAIQFELEAAA